MVCCLGRLSTTQQTTWLRRRTTAGGGHLACGGRSRRPMTPVEKHDMNVPKVANEQKVELLHGAQGQEAQNVRGGEGRVDSHAHSWICAAHVAGPGSRDGCVHETYRARRSGRAVGVPYCPAHNLVSRPASQQVTHRNVRRARSSPSKPQPGGLEKPQYTSQVDSA